MRNAALHKIRLFIAFILGLLFQSPLLQAQTNVNGNQTGTWTLAGSPYILTGSITIPSGQTLTIQPGVEVQSSHYNDIFTVNGTLKAQGTVIDSIKFRGFASSSTPASTHGGFIFFTSGSSNSVLEYVSIDKWGDKDYFSAGTGAINIGTSSISISKSSIQNSEKTGISINTSAITPVLSEINFINNDQSVYAYPSSVGSITNCKNARIVLNSNPTGANCTIPKPGNNSFYELESGFTVSLSTTATIQPGVEIRSYHYNDQIIINGTLKAQGTVADSIKFTGFSNPSIPTSTHGGFIFFQTGSLNSVLEYVSIDKWGDKDYFSVATGAINISTSSISISKSNIRNSEKIGVHINTSTIVPVLSEVSFSNNGQSVYAYPSSVGGIFNCSNARIVLNGNSTGGTCTIPKPGNGSFYELESGFTVSASTTTTIQPGVEIRSYHYNDQIIVNGTLKAQGAISDSIKFKGFASSSIPASTHGGFIFFQAGSTNSTLEYVSMDKWGDKDYFSAITGAINISTSSVSIIKSNIRNSETAGIYINVNGVSPILSEISFINNEQSILSHTSSLGGIVNCKDARVILLNSSIGIDCILPKPGINSYYELNGGFTISSGKTLTIQPGVEIRSYHYNDQITVNGAIKAQGLHSDSIFFRGFSYPSIPASSHGGFILFQFSSINSILEYVAIDRWGDKDYFSAATGAINITTGSVSILKAASRIPRV